MRPCAAASAGYLLTCDQKFFLALHVGIFAFISGHRAISRQYFIRRAIRCSRISSLAFIFFYKSSCGVDALELPPGTGEKLLHLLLIDHCAARPKGHVASVNNLLPLPIQYQRRVSSNKVS